MERQRIGNNLPRKTPSNGPKTNLNRKKMQPSAPQKRKIGREQPYEHFEGIPDDSFPFSRPQGTSNSILGDPQSAHGTMGLNFPGAEKRIISLDFKSKRERHDIRSKLENELSLVRNLVRRIEVDSSTSNMKFPVNNFGGNHSGKFRRVRSEVGSIDFSQTTPLDQHVTPGVENSQGANSGFSKGPRKLKKNELYQSPDPALGKDKIMPADNKKSKTNGKRNGEGVGVAGSVSGMGNSSSKIFKSCNALLEKLMRHKSGWIFSSPVDVTGLGLHDYYTIIKQPMDLGTVKSKLNSNWYKTPEDFAEDVRLTFHNAIRYNPEGHNVHVSAKQLLKMFEDKWLVIVPDYSRETNFASDYQEVIPKQEIRRAPPPPQASPIYPPNTTTMIADKSETLTNAVDPEPTHTNSVQSGRGRVPKKPKARDPNKRDMTYEEKQKLSNNLQNLPSEKLETVLHIIKKRNPHMCQNDEEIEVDIDHVDTETLWELDRFVINFKKNLSKIKRSAEMAQAGAGTELNLEEENEAHSVMEEPIENKSDDKNAFSSSPVQVQVQGEAEGRSASVSNGSSSSSSDSASSSSDSDSDSSSS